jgi:hypothetical protein
MKCLIVRGHGSPDGCTGNTAATDKGRQPRKEAHDHGEGTGDYQERQKLIHETSLRPTTAWVSYAPATLPSRRADDHSGPFLHRCWLHLDARTRSAEEAAACCCRGLTYQCATRPGWSAGPSNQPTWPLEITQGHERTQHSGELATVDYASSPVTPVPAVLVGEDPCDALEAGRLEPLVGAGEAGEVPRFEAGWRDLVVAWWRKDTRAPCRLGRACRISSRASLAHHGVTARAIPVRAYG